MDQARFRQAVAKANQTILLEWLREYGSPITKRLIEIGDMRKLAKVK